MITPSSALAATPSFENGPEFSSDTGHILLSWQSEEPAALILADNPEFAGASAIYSGPETSFFVSGLSNGDYFLRLESESGAVSDMAQLTVAHQSLTQALWLTVIGLLITLGILAVILKGARDD